MPYNLQDDWSKVVKVLARNYEQKRQQTLGDLVSYERGSRGEKFVMKTFKNNGYGTASYYSRTQGDVWAIGSHTCHGYKVTSIALVQVKTSASRQYRFQDAQDELRELVAHVRTTLRNADGTDHLPRVRSNSRLVVSGWLASVADANKSCSFDHVRLIGTSGIWPDGESEQKLIRDAVATLVGRILS